MYAVITGASRGIGKALAYVFARHNYDLILTCENNIDLLNEIKNDIKNKYKRNIIVKKGLLTKEDLNDDIYVLINNAGKCDYNLFCDISYEKYKDITYANLDYAFLTTKLISPIFLKNKQGIIINISSMWGIYGSALESIYSMTKGGINALTKSLAKEFKEANVDVIAFALGAVDTDMNSHLKDIDRDEFLKTLDGNKMFNADYVAKTIYETIMSRTYNSGDIILLNNGLM